MWHVGTTGSMLMCALSHHGSLVDRHVSGYCVLTPCLPTLSPHVEKGCVHLVDGIGVLMDGIEDRTNGEGVAAGHAMQKCF